MPRQEFQDYSFLCPLLQLPYQVYFALVTAINRAKPGERKERFLDYVLRDRLDVLKNIFGEPKIHRHTKYFWKKGNYLVCLQAAYDFADTGPVRSILVFRGIENDWRSWKILLAWNKQHRFSSFDELVENEISSGEFFTLFHTLNAQ